MLERIELGFVSRTDDNGRILLYNPEELDNFLPGADTAAKYRKLATIRLSLSHVSPHATNYLREFKSRTNS